MQIDDLEQKKSSKEILLDFPERSENRNNFDKTKRKIQRNYLNERKIWINSKFNLKYMNNKRTEIKYVKINMAKKKIQNKKKQKVNEPR